jgi:aspartate/methionine/tyrosine aminotransferase
LGLNERMLGLKLAIRRISELASHTPGCLRFDLGQPEFDTPIHIKEGAIKAIREGFTGYTSSFGIPELRRAIAEKEREKGLEIDENNVLVTSGGTCALSCCLLNILSPGDELIVSNPFWAPYEFITVNAHGKLVPTRYFEDDEFKPSNIEENISERTKAIVVNTPENPTGRVLEEKELEEIVEIAEEEDLFLISDEVYEKIVFEGAEHHSVAAMAPDRSFLVNSCSKTYSMTGWRVGWIVGQEKFIDTLMKTNRALTACPNSIAQKAALEALTGLQNCVEEMRRAYQKRRNYAVKKFKEMGLEFIVPKGTFYIFPDLDRDPWKFSLGLLEEKKVSVVPGDAFGSAGETCVRLALTIGMEDVREGLGRIEEYLNR